MPRNELETTLRGACTRRTTRWEPFTISHDDQVAKVSVVGLGMAEQTGVAERMFRALADAEINIQMITTSEIKISTLIHRDQALLGLRSVHQRIQLGPGT